MERLLTPREAAELLAVTSKTIKEWLRRGELGGVRVRRLWRIKESDLDRFVKGGDRLSQDPAIEKSRNPGR